MSPHRPFPAALAESPVAARAGEKLLRVGELAEQTGKTRRAIRFYEELGLLHPAQRTKGGFRQYDGAALVRIVNNGARRNQKPKQRHVISVTPLITQVN